MLKLNLGSGPKAKHRDGWVNIDLLPDADVQVDLESGCLPYPDNSVDEVACHQVFEHIRNLIPLINDIHRVLKPGGFMHCSVPCVNSPLHAFSDPTHVRFFTEWSWAYYQKDAFFHTDVGSTYGITPWADIRQEIEDGWNLVAVLRK